MALAEESAFQVGAVTVRLAVCDITTLQVDGVVNAANTNLWMGSGVAGAIKRAGGPGIEREAMAQAPVSLGEAVVTGGGALPARYVIHAATLGDGRLPDGPGIWRATLNALTRSAELGLESVALPALGTGVGGLSLDAAARAMMEAVLNHAAAHRLPNQVFFALFSDLALRVFTASAATWLAHGSPPPAAGGGGGPWLA